MFARKLMQTDPFRNRLTTFSVGLPRTVCSFVCDFIALEIMGSEANFSPRQLLGADQKERGFWGRECAVRITSDAYALETRRRFVTERRKKM